MAKDLNINMLPKQYRFYKELLSGTHSVIGIGGGRGSSKSSCLDIATITLMSEIQGLNICMVMRTWQSQIVPFHIEPIRKNFPWLADNLKISPPAVLRIGTGTLEFKYAQNQVQVEEAFRSGNYDVILVDQSEQFTISEINEIRKACRSTHKKFPIAKLVLSFNMRGSSVQEHKKMFLTKEVVNPEEYWFLKFNPWDNVFWVQEALKEDGYTLKDYYSWTNIQRKEYAAEKGPYTKLLATDDQVISKSDWEGSWDSLEGTYFSNSWDLESTRITPEQSKEMERPWANYWISQDWGKSHFNVTYWHYRVSLSPAEIYKCLGYVVKNPMNVIVTYREMILSEKESTEIAQCIVDSTPVEERKLHKAFFLGKDAFADRDSPNTIAIQESKILQQNGLPCAQRANDSRISGYALMGKLLKASKGHGYFLSDSGGLPVQSEDIWLISSDCIELLKAIPTLMRNPKNLDDVLKTDKSSARIDQDTSEAARYGLFSMLAPKKKTEEQKFQEQMSKATPEQRMLINFRHVKIKEKRQTQISPPSWRGNKGQVTWK